MEISTDSHLESALLGFSQLHGDDTYTDLTIACGGKEYRVHKAIVCSHSDVFKAACWFPGKEANEGWIDLSDDDPNMIKRMVYYFYHFKYLPTTPSRLAKLLKIADDETGSDLCHCLSTPEEYREENWDEDECPSDNHRCLVTHGSMYGLADKYQCAGLKDLSRNKFKTALRSHGIHSVVEEVIPMICTMTPEADSRLEILVAELLADYPCLMEGERMETLMKEYSQVAFYVLKSMHLFKES